MRRLLETTLALVALLGASACASTPVDTPAAAVAPVEPIASVAPVAPVTAAPTERTFRLAPWGDGWTLSGIFDQIQRQMGISILYDETSTTFKQAKVTVCGVHSVRADELFDWLSAVLSYRKLALVPVGPKSADSKPQWFVIDFSDDGRS